MLSREESHCIITVESQSLVQGVSLMSDGVEILVTSATSGAFDETFEIVTFREKNVDISLHDSCV